MSESSGVLYLVNGKPLIKCSAKINNFWQSPSEHTSANGLHCQNYVKVCRSKLQ